MADGRERSAAEQPAAFFSSVCSELELFNAVVDSLSYFGGECTVVCCSFPRRHVAESKETKYFFVSDFFCLPLRR